MFHRWLYQRVYQNSEYSSLLFDTTSVSLRLSKQNLYVQSVEVNWIRSYLEWFIWLCLSLYVSSDYVYSNKRNRGGEARRIWQRDDNSDDISPMIISSAFLDEAFNHFNEGNYWHGRMFKIVSQSFTFRANANAWCNDSGASFDGFEAFFSVQRRLLRVKDASVPPDYQWIIPVVHRTSIQEFSCRYLHRLKSIKINCTFSTCLHCLCLCVTVGEWSAYSLENTIDAIHRRERYILFIKMFTSRLLEY